MKKYLFILTSLFIYATAVNAQGFDPSKLSFGGSLGFGFGANNYFGISASPQVGYNVSSKFLTGLGLSYSYSTEDNELWSGGEWKYTRNYAGVNIFANYYPISKIVITARPEIIRMWQNYTETGSGSRFKYSSDKVVPAFVVGAGVRFRPVLLTLNYDLVQNDNSPYSNSVFFNIGVMF